MRKPSGNDESKERKFQISPLTPIPFICFAIVAGIDSLISALLAALLHECGHLAAIRLCKGRISKVIVYPFGGEIVLDEKLLSYRESIFVSAAGIAVNLFSAGFIVFFGKSMLMTKFCICSLALGLFNLLPLRQLDGGSILFSVLSFLTDPFTSEKICGRVYFITSLLFAVLLLSCVHNLGFNPTLIMLACYFLLELF